MKKLTAVELASQKSYLAAFHRDHPEGNLETQRKLSTQILVDEREHNRYFKFLTNYFNSSGVPNQLNVVLDLVENKNVCKAIDKILSVDLMHKRFNGFNDALAKVIRNAVPKKVQSHKFFAE